MCEELTDKQILDEINSVEGFHCRWELHEGILRDGILDGFWNPIEELEAQRHKPICTDCGEDLEEEYYYFEDDETDRDYHVCCAECAHEMAQSWAEEAEVYAKDHCRIIGRLEQYDARYHHACTPEEYVLGDKWSYTQKSVRCENRHGGCTNYDKLIKPLREESLKHAVYYEAIRARIDFLLNEAEERGFFDDEQDMDS